MNQYHNPYRNPYPGRGAARYAEPHENASQPSGLSGTPQPEAPAPGEPQGKSQAQPQPGEKAGSGPQDPGKNAPPSSSGQEKASWQNDPSLKNMDLKKLAFLSELVAESGSKPLDALLPFLVAANQNANSMGLQFNDAETSLLLEVLKKHMNPEEQSRIDMLRKMADMLGKKNG